MKKTLLAAASAMAVMGASAQTLNVHTGPVHYIFDAANVGDMVYNGGTSLTMKGKTFAVADITSMYVDDAGTDDNLVSVVYDGDNASVTVAGNIARYVTVTVDGAAVSIVQSEDVSETTCGEITYELSGASQNGTFYMEGSYKATMELRGLTLTNPSGAAIDIQNGKRIDFSVKSGTDNVLTDGAGGSQKGCLVCKGHLEMKGKGNLTVYGNTAHAIYAKEYIELKNCTVDILSAVKDGINCTQYFAMESGSVNISGTGDDGIQVDYKDSADRDSEDTGSITVSGGTLAIDVTATAAKAAKAEGDINISGDAVLTLSVSGGGLWDDSKVKTKASACLSSDENISIDGGTLTLTATGSGGKGLSCDGDLHITGGDITVSTSGGMYAYVNGREYENYTGNTDNLDSDQKSSPKGMKADGNVLIDGGTINITTRGVGGEGIESKAELTVNGGTIVINAYDDGLNSSSHMHLNGGDITVVATNNDGIDSNGNLYIAGGYIRACGASGVECGIDANEEEGYSVVFTGGTVLALGGGNSVPSSTSSTQAYITASVSAAAGSTVSLKDGDTVLATFTVPDNYTSASGGMGGNRPGGMGGMGGMGGGGFLITCEGLVSGNSYTLVSGTSTTSVTATLRSSGSGNRPW